MGFYINSENQYNLSLSKAVKNNIELKKLQKDADEGTGIYNDHLRRILTQLQKTPEVLEALKVIAHRNKESVLTT